MSVRLRDVARAAGVSAATASKALNNRADVSPQTRARVIDAARELGFEPGATARSLISGESRTVGILTSDLVGRWALPILVGAEDAFGAGQMSVLLADAREDQVREQHNLRTLLARRVDGVIVVGSRTEPRPSLGDLGIPVVYAYAPSDDPADMSITPDNDHGARLVVEHLVSLGRRHIAIIAGDRDFAAARERFDGTVNALAEHGLAPAPRVPLYGSWTEAWGAAATRALLDGGGSLDAIVCQSDQIARGCLTALQSMGVRVPHDVAVTGFDNWDAMVEGAQPHLTSIDMDIPGLGRRAAEMLVNALSSPPRGGLERTPCRLVVRGSTAASAP